MKSKNSSFKIAVILTTVILAIIAALVVINNLKSETTNESIPGKKPSIEGQPTLGKADAPVSVVEFGDFKCPSCKAWGETVFPKLVEDYVDTGKVKFSYINALFHGEESKLGAVAAESVFKNSPDSYWEFHKALFKEQPSQNHDGLWITQKKILEVANSITGTDVDKLKSDIEQESVMEEVNKDTELVEEFNIQQTPTIVVNGKVLEDPFDYEKIKSLIEKDLEGKQ
ncbi:MULTISPECIES: DsbA family protein [Peribacillus]|uniref:DsbA family protein n=1 Tax=Peribacillus TaxID=2675229 RepID=UPI000BA56AD9|nr:MULTISPECIES: DsbA family protein [Peribacillus]MCM3169534.1 DsbA family protein [Peribacillus frigoritolerans]PAL08029.1 dihydroneopterin aldolase [Peribacillus simplex]